MRELSNPTKPLEKIFGDNLAELRGRRTQAQMAELLDVSVGTYQRWEAAEIIPQERARSRISERLGIPEGRLFADPEYVATPEEALEVLKRAVERAKALESLTPSQRQLLDLLPSLKDNQVRLLLDTVRKTVGIADEMERKGKKA